MPSSSKPLDADIGPQNGDATTWKITLCYDGSQFFGWQVQPGRATVQQALKSAIFRVTGETVLPQGSGRTDAGVHALAQVASCALRAPIPPQNLKRALNHALPPSIRVLAAERAAPHFHARHSSVGKSYEYRIWRAKLCPPWNAPYVTAWDFPVNLELLHRAAAQVLGMHDFRSFESHEAHAAAQADPNSVFSRDFQAQAVPDAIVGAEDVPGVSGLTVKTLTASSWSLPEAEMLVYRVEGSGFLHHMVRNLVGTFLAIGRGQIDPDAMPAILAARQRSAAGPTAPSNGLWLHSVEYPAGHLQR
jgi:tRNA pseudouridine38-40 synthase